MKHSLALGLIGVFAVGCGEGTADMPLTAPSLGVGGGNRVVESVSGSGSFIVTTQQGDWRTFSFTARRYADGTVAGEWQRVRRQDGNAEGSHAHGVVVCFAVLGNTAWIGARATSGFLSDPPNNEGGFRVQDNGEGANAAAPDRMSLEFVGAAPGYAQTYCNDRPNAPAPFFDLETGNIQIR